MFQKAADLETEKREAIERLKTEQGRREFMSIFEEILANYRRLIEKGGDFLVGKEADDMKATADEIRDQEPEVARFIDQAREKIEDLLKKAKADRSKS